MDETSDDGNDRKFEKKDLTYIDQRQESSNQKPYHLTTE
jgi:hypothetical protein